MAGMDTLITHPPFEYCVSYRVPEIRLRLLALGLDGEVGECGCERRVGSYGAGSARGYLRSWDGWS